MPDFAVVNSSDFPMQFRILPSSSTNRGVMYLREGRGPRFLHDAMITVESGQARRYDCFWYQDVDPLIGFSLPTYRRLADSPVQIIVDVLRGDQWIEGLRAVRLGMLGRTSWVLVSNGNVEVKEGSTVLAHVAFAVKAAKLATSLLP